MPFVFSHVEYCDMHFVYGFCNGNARAAVEEYQYKFQVWSQSDKENQYLHVTDAHLDMTR
jgi:hypothetical protein